MTVEKIFLASDNGAPVHPDIMHAILEANRGCAPSYGSDRWTTQAQELVQEAFAKECKVFFIPTGTGSNVLALKLSCKRHESVVCSDIAHIHYQESGAAESIVGCKLVTVPSIGGKISPAEVLKKLKRERAFGPHSTSPKVLSITQPTEVGTCYSREEIQALKKLCKEENLYLHMDGNRLYNAAVSLNLTLKEMVEGVDILSLGGTKNGLMYAEMVLIFNSALEEGAAHLQKQSLLLFSKMRYTAAQVIPFFEKKLWHALALHANQKAREIASLIEATPELSLSYKVETNQIFFTAPASWVPLIREKIACFVWSEEKNEIRFIPSWVTTSKEVEQVRSILQKLSKHKGKK